jgi:ParB family chromosome partitioning protein
VAQLPRDTGDLWDALSGLDGDSRQALFTHCVGLTVNATCQPYDRRPKAIAHAGRLAEAVQLDMAAAGWRPSVATVSRAHHPARRRARALRGHRQGADRVGRAARDGRALRGVIAASGDGALLLDPQAGPGALPALGLRRGAHHDAPAGAAAPPGRHGQAQHRRGRGHLLGQDHARQRPARRGRQPGQVPAHA